MVNKQPELNLLNYLNNSIDKNVFIPYDSSKGTIACFFNESKILFNYKKNDRKYEANKGKDFVITEIYRQLNILVKCSCLWIQLRHNSKLITLNLDLNKY